MGYIFWQPMANKKKRKLTWEISVPWFNHQLRVQNVWTRFEIEGAFGEDAPSSQILCGKFEESKTKAPLGAWRLSLCRLLRRLFQPGNRRALANENKRNPSMPCLLKSELSNQSQISPKCIPKLDQNLMMTFILETASSACIIRVALVGCPSQTSWGKSIALGFILLSFNLSRSNWIHVSLWGQMTFTSNLTLSYI